MTITKQYSIALDSTLSSTPPPSPSPLMTPVRRATRTYGRPRDPKPPHDPDSSLSMSESSSASRQSLYRTAPPDVDEEIPPSSDGLPPDDSDSDSIILAEVLPKQRYHDWRNKLSHIDQRLDDDDDDDATKASASKEPPAGTDTSDVPNRKDPGMSLLHERPRETATTSGRGVELPVNDSLSGFTLSPTSPECQFKGSPAIRRRSTRRPAVVPDSDLEENAIPSSPTSPLYPNPITTPNLHPASTPPTSVEMPKGKGKARDVPPLRFEETQVIPAPAKTKNKSAKNKRKPSEQKTKIKGPTKKERLDIKREHLRIAADRQIFIPHSENHKYTMEKLFATLTSDPIQQFSSSPAVGAPSPAPPDAPPRRAAPQAPLQESESILPERVSSPAPRALNSDSDADPPDVGDILHEQKKHDAAERARDLAERKRRALAEAASRREHLLEGSDDDGGLEVIGGDKDMHVVAEEEAGERRAIKAKHIRPSEGRKRQLLLGRVRAGDVGKGKGVIQTETAVGRLRIVESQSELNRMMAIRVQRTNREVTRRKEEEWTKRGGKTGVMQDTGLQVKDVLKAYAKKGLKAKEEGEEMDLDGEATGGSDEEWTPDMRGSASPSPDHKDNTDAQSEEEDHEIESEKRLLDDGKLTDADEEAADQAKMRPRAPRHSTTRPRAILDSDQEDDENENPHWSGRPHKNDLVLNSSAEENVNSTPVHQMPGIIHRGSMSSFDEPTEDENENDKENNTRLMYDKSEDKENKAVVRHSLGSLTRLPLSRVETLYSLDGTRRGLSTSPSGVRVAGDEIGGEQSRTPFKELLEDDDDPFISQPRTTFAARLQEASLSSPSITPEPLVFGGGNLGFSQSDNADENEPFGPQPSSKPKSPNQDNGGISPKPLTLLKSGSGPFSQFLSEDQGKSGFDKLRNADELSLTLDVRLQPALEVSENVMRQADSIFEKEQEYVLEAATRKPKQKTELYVNDHGFLTQTRPDVSSPEIYRPASPFQKGSMFAHQQLREETTRSPSSQPAQRRPLRTLSLLDELESPGPLRRLKKRNMSPPLSALDEGYRSSPSPSPTKRLLNAFEVLAQARNKPSNKLEKSEFVETEAQESDDDEMLGFGGYRKQTAEEEEEGEDLDKALEGLVDDAHMDEQTLGQDLVLEKVKEHQAEDDASLEKYAKAIAEGQLRVKRRNRGIGLDDSDEDEDEDEDAKRIRRKIFKKRKIEGDTLDDLAQNETTLAFYNAYHDNDDVDNELAHLQKEVMVLTHEQDEELDDNSHGVVTAAEIRERVREIAQQDEVREPLDPNDVSWLDREHSQDDDEERISIKEVSLTSRRSHVRCRSALGQMDLDENNEAPKRPFESEQERARMSSWAKSEGKSRNVGTGRSAVGAAVTGHGKPRVKAGGGSLRTARASSSGSTGTEPRKVTALRTTSMLAAVADRSLRFDQP